MEAETPAKRKRSDMGGKEKAKGTKLASIAVTHSRIRRLVVKNFRCIGELGVNVILDEIVILVGANNTGKSAVLKAYEIALRSGEKAAELNIEDFPRHYQPKPDEEHLFPEIILETVVTEDTKPADKWILKDNDTKELYVRERWRWSEPGRASHVGFNVEIDRWADKEEEKVPWGCNGVAKPKRPEPLRLSPFDSPDKMAETLTKLLKNPFKEQVSQSDTSALANLVDLYKKLLDAASLETKIVLKTMTDIVRQIFPEHEVRMRPPHDVDLNQSVLELLPSISPKLCLGFGDHFSPLEKQGSGAQRMLMWAALRATAETKQLTKGKDKEKDREPSQTKSYLLLIDEPELCLHPTAVRQACKILQEMANLPNWQVMITTHSPVFVDLRANNTSIVRVDRDEASNSYTGTTIYRPANAKLDEDDIENLTMLTAFDPYVAEFFFSKNIIVVEGDTEYVAFQTTMSLLGEVQYSDVHIIRARGKPCVPTICKILNQFQKPYSVLHDSDAPKRIDKKTGKQVDNGRWTDNKNIADIASPRARVVAMVPNFERAMRRLGKSDDKKKPYEVYKELKSEGGKELLSRMKMLLDFLLHKSDTVPEFCVAWHGIEKLEEAYSQAEPAYNRKNRQGNLFADLPEHLL